MARLINKATREYTCALIMMFFGSLAAFGGRVLFATSYTYFGTRF